MFFLLYSDDLSVGKIAIQSHTYSPPSSLYSANNAVDRNTDTCTKTRAIGYGAQFNVVFWVVDLGRVHNIFSIDTLFKNDLGDGMHTYNNKKQINTLL